MKKVSASEFTTVFIEGGPGSGPRPGHAGARKNIADKLKAIRKERFFSGDYFSPRSRAGINKVIAKRANRALFLGMGNLRKGKKEIV